MKLLRSDKVCSLLLSAQNHAQERPRTDFFGFLADFNGSSVFVRSVGSDNSVSKMKKNLLNQHLPTTEYHNWAAVNHEK